MRTVRKGDFMDDVQVHEFVTHHIPGFLPAADGSDTMMTWVAIGMIGAVLGVGILYLTLHALPEKMAHGTNHSQLQIIGILAVIALFTHNNIFWVLALLIAAFRMPDFLTPLQRIADSLDEIKEQRR